MAIVPIHWSIHVLVLILLLHMLLLLLEVMRLLMALEVVVLRLPKHGSGLILLIAIV